MPSTRQKLHFIKHPDCLCDMDLCQIEAAVRRKNGVELKAAVDSLFSRYRIEGDAPNVFKCAGCEKRLKFDVEDSKPTPTAQSQPKRVPVQQPTPPTHCILLESRTLPLNVDPLEGVSPEIRQLAKTAAKSNDFRYTVGLHNYRTMEDWLRSVGRYDLDLKELAACQKRLLSGENCTREQINKTLRREIWRHWNTECLEQTFSGLVHSGLSQPSYSDLAKLLTAQQARDLIEKEARIAHKTEYMRQLVQRGKLVAYGKGRARYPLFSVLEYIASRR